MRFRYVWVGLLLTACQTNSPEISSYPEARSYADCVKSKSQAYAAQSGSPVDLAFVAVAACRPYRNAMEQALRRDNSATFVATFMRLNDRTMLEIAAEAIAEARR